MNHLIAEAKEQAKSGNIESALATLNQLDKESADYHASAGEIYLLYGKHDDAKSHLDKCVELLQKDKSTLYIQVLSNLGILYWNQGKENQALDQLYNAFSIAEKHQDTDLLLLADLKNNIGLVLSSTNAENALSYYRDALAIYEKIDNQTEKRAQTIINIAIINKNKEQYQDALSSFNQALELIENKYGKKHTTASFILTNLGQIYAAQNDAELGHYYYGQALEIYKEIYGEKHPEIANIYSLQGDMALNRNEFKQALHQYQKALIANSYEFNNDNINALPRQDDVIKPNSMLFILSRKAAALEKYYYGHSLKNQHLIQAINCLILADSIVQSSRHSNYNKQDELALSELTYQLYEIAQSVALQLSKGTIKKKHYQELAFQFSEKSKSASLINAIADSEAKSFAGIPPTLLEQESNLNNNIAFFELQLATAENENDRKAIREKLSSLKQDYISFLQQLESDYPEYYSLKNRSSLLSVNQITNQLKDDEMILSYGYLDKNKQILLYAIDKKGLKVYEIDNLDEIKRNIRGYRNALRYKLKNEYVNLSQSLYEHLLPLRINKNINKLHIITDGELGKIPFETLLTEKPNSLEFNKMPFLIRQYSISYNFSVNLIFKSASSEAKPKNALLFAPVSFRQHKGLNDLPASDDELNNIGVAFSSANREVLSLKKESALKNSLVNDQLSNFGYIHLATHGKVDEFTPELSRLYMGGSDDILYANEIYNWSLNAHLVCLSACETGLGKLTRAEGLIGLGRAFSFAGADNIIVSLWTVADQSTSELMSLFYKYHLDENAQNDISNALRLAKLELINSKEMSAPYFWSPFIQIGH